MLFLSFPESEFCFLNSRLTGLRKFLAQIVKKCHNKIRDYKHQIKDIKGVSVCEKCGAEVAVNSAFCSACGAPMPVVKPVSETAEEAEEEGDPIRRPAVSTNLDPQDLSDTEPPTRQH